MPYNLILGNENVLRYILKEFRQSMKIMGMDQEYIQKHTSEDNGGIESFHRSLKTYFNW